MVRTVWRHAETYWNRVCRNIMDEILLEAKEELAEKAKEMLSEEMIKAAREYCPHTRIVADAYVADCWMK